MNKQITNIIGSLDAICVLQKFKVEFSFGVLTQDKYISVFRILSLGCLWRYCDHFGRGVTKTQLKYPKQPSRYPSVTGIMGITYRVIITSLRTTDFSMS